VSDSMLFRKYAREAMAGSQASKNENEKLVLNELAGMWIKAATASETMFTSPPLVPGTDEATPLTRH
jgi:hypothetical protein